jgi:hypothetical protein
VVEEVLMVAVRLSLCLAPEPFRTNIDLTLDYLMIHDFWGTRIHCERSEQSLKARINKAKLSEK